jgi:hypothetical protein
MNPERDEIHLDWLKAAEHGLTWEESKRVLAEIEQRRKDQAAAVAKRLLGNKSGWVVCPRCFVEKKGGCLMCFGTGRINA